MDELLASLEQRVARLEQEVRDLKAEQSMRRGERLFRQAQQTKPLTKEEMDKLLASLGLTNVPLISPEQLQQELLAAGIRPEDNSFSRGIIEMREE